MNFSPTFGFNLSDYDGNEQMNRRNRRPWQPLLGDKKTFWGDQNKKCASCSLSGTKIDN